MNETVIGRTPGAPSPSQAAAQEAAAKLLAIVGRLAAESRPGDSALPQPALDSLLDRDLGFDSLSRVELVMRLEAAFDVRLPQHLLGEAATPRDLLRAVLAGSPRADEALAALPRYEPTRIDDTSPMHVATLPELLDWHASRHPDREHIVLLGDDGEGAGEPVTYARLRDEALAVARGLARRGIGAGDAVALMLPTSRDFFRAFMGIVLAGAAPAPIYPPLRRGDLADHLRRQSRILDNCRARILVAPAHAAAATRMLRGLVPTLERVASPEELAAEGGAQALPAARAADIALLQYTSGSTGDPKGVVITHANVLANVRAMGTAVKARSDDVFVSWLPLYHDMGLIGAWMGAMHYAFPLVVMPPTAFVSRPSRWLRAIHRFRGTISSAPNFAYEICATRIDPRDVEGLDLSSWRLAFNGAEPVSVATLERFASRYGACGFRREALMPVYGLAECAVGLAFPPAGRGPRVDRVDRAALARTGEARPAAEGAADPLLLAGCGSPLPGHELRIVDRDARELPDRAEGRIQFRGPSATSGYFRDAARTQALFRDGWLDTGDVGYVAGGELFVTGRVKDVIIRGGQHVHPHELEEAIGRLPGIRKGCVAVFGVPNHATGSENVVVLAETRLAAGAARDLLQATVRETAVALLGTPPDVVRLVPPHTVPKTSSGKIRRAASREVYLGGTATAGLWSFAASLARARLRRSRERLAQWSYAAWMWAAAAPLALCALAVSLCAPPRARWRALRALARAILRASRTPLAVEGLERIPATGPVVIVANHASYLDGPLLLALLPRPARFVAKRELAANPLLRTVLRGAGVAFVERFEAERGALESRELVSHAREGEALVFFPEGTFTRAPGLLPFHMGAFVTSAQSGAPVVPVTIRGVRSILRDGQWRPRRSGGIRVHAGPAIVPASGDWNEAVRLRDAARAAMLAQCAEPDLAQAGWRSSV